MQGSDSSPTRTEPHKQVLATSLLQQIAVQVFRRVSKPPKFTQFQVCSLKAMTQSLPLSGAQFLDENSKTLLTGISSRLNDIDLKLSFVIDLLNGSSGQVSMPSVTNPLTEQQRQLNATMAAVSTTLNSIQQVKTVHIPHTVTGLFASDANTVTSNHPQLDITCREQLSKHIVSIGRQLMAKSFPSVSQMHERHFCEGSDLFFIEHLRIIP